MPAGNPAGYLPNVKKRLKRMGKKPYVVRAKRNGTGGAKAPDKLASGPAKGLKRPGLPAPQDAMNRARRQAAAQRIQTLRAQSNGIRAGLNPGGKMGRERAIQKAYKSKRR